MFVSSPTIISGKSAGSGFTVSASNVISGSVKSLGNNYFLSTANTATLRSTGNLKTLSNPYLPPNVFTFIFGVNASQNINSLIIKKNDLYGLTPANNNTAESLVVGIINRLLGGSAACEFPKFSSKYWGYGTDEGKRIDTVLIHLRNNLSTSNNEIAEYNTTIDPDSY